MFHTLKIIVTTNDIIYVYLVYFIFVVYLYMKNLYVILFQKVFPTL